MSTSFWGLLYEHQKLCVVTVWWWNMSCCHKAYQTPLDILSVLGLSVVRLECSLIWLSKIVYPSGVSPPWRTVYDKHAIAIFPDICQLICFKRYLIYFVFEVDIIWTVSLTSASLCLTLSALMHSLIDTWAFNCIFNLVWWWICSLRMAHLYLIKMAMELASGIFV